MHSKTSLICTFSPLLHATQKHMSLKFVDLSRFTHEKAILPRMDSESIDTENIEGSWYLIFYFTPCFLFSMLHGNIALQQVVVNLNGTIVCVPTPHCVMAQHTSGGYSTTCESPLLSSCQWGTATLLDATKGAGKRRSGAVHVFVCLRSHMSKCHSEFNSWKQLQCN